MCVDVRVCVCVSICMRVCARECICMLYVCGTKCVCMYVCSLENIDSAKKGLTEASTHHKAAVVQLAKLDGDAGGEEVPGYIIMKYPDVPLTACVLLYWCCILSIYSPSFVYYWYRPHGTHCYCLSF